MTTTIVIIFLAIAALGLYGLLRSIRKKNLKPVSPRVIIPFVEEKFPTRDYRKPYYPYLRPHKGEYARPISCPRVLEAPFAGTEFDDNVRVRGAVDDDPYLAFAAGIVASGILDVPSSPNISIYDSSSGEESGGGGSGGDWSCPSIPDTSSSCDTSSSWDSGCSYDSSSTSDSSS